MQVTVIARGNNHVRVDGVSHVVDMPKDSDPSRPLMTIHFDGVQGHIERRSKVPGKTDIEHFMDVAVLEPYLAAWRVKQAEAEAERKAQAQAAAEQSAEPSK